MVRIWDLTWDFEVVCLGLNLDLGLNGSDFRPDCLVLTQWFVSV